MWTGSLFTGCKNLFWQYCVPAFPAVTHKPRRGFTNASAAATRFDKGPSILRQDSSQPSRSTHGETAGAAQGYRRLCLARFLGRWRGRSSHGRSLQPLLAPTPQCPSTSRRHRPTRPFLSLEPGPDQPLPQLLAAGPALSAVSRAWSGLAGQEDGGGSLRGPSSPWPPPPPPRCPGSARRSRVLARSPRADWPRAPLSRDPRACGPAEAVEAPRSCVGAAPGARGKMAAGGPRRPRGTAGAGPSP